MDLAGIEAVLGNFRAAGDPGTPFRLTRVRNAPFATVGKGLGDLRFDSAGAGHFVMGVGERLAVGGSLTIDHADDVVTLGDVAALGDVPGAGSTPGVLIDAAEIGLVRRAPGVTLIGDGETTQDGGSLLIANSFDFGGADLRAIGAGRLPTFALPNTFGEGVPDFVANFPAQAISADGSPLREDSFRFDDATFSEEVRSPLAGGPSRSELTGRLRPRGGADPPAAQPGGRTAPSGGTPARTGHPDPRDAHRRPDRPPRGRRHHRRRVPLGHRGVDGPGRRHGVAPRRARRGSSDRALRAPLR